MPCSSASLPPRRWPIGLGKPIYGVNHLASHVAVDQLEHGALPEPCLAMLVSGGHSSLLRVEDVTGHGGGVEPLGATIDDAAGEAFDKVARLLGLPFPGGPHIDRAARDGQVTIDFPRGLTGRRDLERHRFDFSFSGLKTAVARWVETQQRDGVTIDVGDVAASFQEAVCDVLVRKALDAATDQGIDDLLIGGGVAANSRLRAMATERAEARGIRVRVPRPGLCTDNGAMVAALGAELVARGRTPSSPRPPRRLLPADHRGRGLARASAAGREHERVVGHVRAPCRGNGVLHRPVGGDPDQRPLPVLVDRHEEVGVVFPDGIVVGQRRLRLRRGPPVEQDGCRPAPYIANPPGPAPSK